MKGRWINIKRLLCVVMLGVGSAALAAPAGPPARPPASPAAPALTVHNYTSASTPVGQPLKGFAPYLFPGDNYDTKTPGGVMWSYFALSEVMVGSDPACNTFDWARWLRGSAHRLHVSRPRRSVG